MTKAELEVENEKLKRIIRNLNRMLNKYSDDWEQEKDNASTKIRSKIRNVRPRQSGKGKKTGRASTSSRKVEKVSKVRT